MFGGTGAAPFVPTPFPAKGQWRGVGAPRRAGETLRVSRFSPAPPGWFVCAGRDARATDLAPMVEKVAPPSLHCGSPPEGAARNSGAGG